MKLFAIMAMCCATVLLATWMATQPQGHGSTIRYEMHVQSDGTVFRMDRETGQLHIFGSAGSQVYAGDIPERIRPSPSPTR